MKSSMFEAQKEKTKQAKGILCHDWSAELGRVFDVASTNRLPNYKRMMRFIMCGPSLGSVCSQETKTLTYIYSLSKELGYICTHSVSRRLAHTHTLAAEGSGLLSITWPWDKHNLGLWHQSRPLLDHTSPIPHMCSHHKNIMGRWPTAAEDFKSFKQFLNLCLELDKYVLKIMNDISINTSNKYIKGTKGTDK